MRCRLRRVVGLPLVTLARNSYLTSRLYALKVIVSAKTSRTPSKTMNTVAPAFAEPSYEHENAGGVDNRRNLIIVQMRLHKGKFGNQHRDYCRTHETSDSFEFGMRPVR